MPPIRSLTSKCFAYYSKLVAVILLLSKVMFTCSCCTEKGLVYITIVVLSSYQPFLYAECIKLNIHTLYNI